MNGQVLGISGNIFDSVKSGVGLRIRPSIY